MAWLSGALLALAGLWIGLGLRLSRRGSDPAGRGLARAYLVVYALVWLLVAGLYALGLALGSRILVALPAAAAALPLLGMLAGAANLVVRRFLSRMPTSGLREVESAARLGFAGKAKALLDSGVAIPDAETGRSLLRAALRGRYARDVVDVLLSAGADPRDPELLARALESPHASVLSFVRHGADPNAVLPSGETLLFAALDRGDMHVVEELVKAGADPNARDRDGWPLLLAHASGRRGFPPGNWIYVRKLIDLGADPKRPGPDGSTLRELFAKASGVHPDHEAALRAIL